jgi:hypothetical protein
MSNNKTGEMSKRIILTITVDGEHGQLVTIDTQHEGTWSASEKLGALEMVRHRIYQDITEANSPQTPPHEQQ